MGLIDEIPQYLPGSAAFSGLDGRAESEWDCSVSMCFSCVCLCMCVCIYVCLYVCLCVCSPVLDNCQQFLSERGHIFEPSLLPLNTYTCHIHGTFSFFFPLLLKTVRLVKAHPFSQSMPFHSCLNSPLSFKFKFLITFWLQGTFSLLNLSSLSSENFLNALLKHY